MFHVERHRAAGPPAWFMAGVQGETARPLAVTDTPRRLQRSTLLVRSGISGTSMFHVKHDFDDGRCGPVVAPLAVHDRSERSALPNAPRAEVTAPHSRRWPVGTEASSSVRSAGSPVRTSSAVRGLARR